MSELIDTTEMYLRTVYELLEEGVPPLRARIAERLHQSGPTVSQTVARMERDGLLTVKADRTIKLTPKGARLARAVRRKHRRPVAGNTSSRTKLNAGCSGSSNRRPAPLTATPSPDSGISDSTTITCPSGRGLCRCRRWFRTGAR